MVDENDPKESEILVGEYVPEMAVANEIRGGANRLMYHMRGFIFTEDPQYFDVALKEMSRLDTGIQDGYRLVERAGHLDKLPTALDEIQTAKTRYEKVMHEINGIISSLSGERRRLEDTARTYMQNARDFLESQNLTFQKDLQESQEKVRVVTDMVNLGNKVHAISFSAQISNDMKMMRSAIEMLGGLDEMTKQLRPITRKPEDIARIDETEKAAQEYIRALDGYIATHRKLTAAERKMKANARAYQGNCTTILKNQYRLMTAGGSAAEASEQIRLVNSIMALGSQVEVRNFKAMANGDIKGMQKAIKKFASHTEGLDRLETITRSGEEMQRIEETRVAGKNYTEAMGVLLEAFSGLNHHRTVMEAAADRYVAQCREFLDSQQKTLADDMHESHRKITLMHEIVISGKDTRIQALKSQALNTPSIMEQGLKAFKTVDSRFQQLVGLTRDAADVDRLQVIQKAGQAFGASMTSFLTGWASLRELDRVREELGQQVIEKTTLLQDTAGKSTDSIAGNAATKLSRASFMMLSGLGASLVLGLVLSLLISRSIISLMRNLASSMGDGAVQVAMASGHIATSSQSMADGASRQAASIEETSSAVEQMAAMTRQNAENSGRADQLMQGANQIVQEAGRAMNELTRSMADISQASTDTAKIISTIDEIAFQTNLLALNAAVEAARAGEAGAGFSVVADEVRNLATRAARAAKNTSGLIETTLKQVEVGSGLLTRTNDAFSQVEKRTREVGELLGKISTASAEQSVGIDQINQTISDMAGVVQHVAANAEEMASASETLSVQADQMKVGVGTLLQLVGASSRRDGEDSKGIVGTPHPRLPAEPPALRRRGTTEKDMEITPDRILAPEEGYNN